MNAHPSEPGISRRTFAQLLTTAAGGSLFGLGAQAQPAALPAAFKLRYVLASSLFGTLPLAEILPQVKATGSEAIDLWPKPHGSQREEIEAMGVGKFVEFLQGTRVEVITRYDLGPFRLVEEIALAKELGTSVIVTGGAGPVGLSGEALKRAVYEFAEKLKPHLAEAESKGVKIAIENHGKNLIDAPDSIRWLVEAVGSPNLGIALAPYHLPQEPELLETLINDLGGRLMVFYGWQYGMGCMQKMPKHQELMQMPGRGALDFVPLVRALKKINFQGATEIFMHPTPRGFPILESAGEVGAEVNLSRGYLDACLARI